MAKLILIILDGFGLSKNLTGNAVVKANPKCFNKLCKVYPTAKLQASSTAVGLMQNQEGNSEVGHLTIGAGKKILTGKLLVDKQIRNNKLLKSSLTKAKKNKNKIHLIGLYSDGLVHSDKEHFHYLIDQCNLHKIKPILHLFSDGRDTPEQQFINDLKVLDKKYIKTNKAIIGSISGRHFAMDRNLNWKKTINVFDAITKIRTDNISPIEYIEKKYEQKITDEFIEPKSFNNPGNEMNENDLIICLNYRSDRMRQITHLLSHSQTFNYQHNDFLNLNVITMTDYKIDNIKTFLVNNDKPITYLGKIISENNLSQLRIAETEKYAHVTYFLDGLNLTKPEGCDTIIIPSPTVDSFDKTPKMSAKFITKAIIENLNKYDIIICNYANADMVGHTGNFNATVKAVKSLDKEIAKLYKEVYIKNKVPIMICADHGNCEKMINENGLICKKHSTNLVPFIFINDRYKLNDSGDLTNITPTILNYLKIKIPTFMSISLIK